VNLVGEAHEQAVFDHARKPRERPGESPRVPDRPEVTVEHEVAVVGHHGTVLALCAPQVGLATALPDCRRDCRPGGGQDLDGHRCVQDLGLLARVDHDQEPIGRRVDDLLACVGPTPALDQALAGDLVGAVDRHVGDRVVEGGQRNRRRSGALAGLERGRDPLDVQSGVDALAQFLDRVCHSAPCPEADDRLVFDSRGRALAGAALCRLRTASFHGR